MPPPNLQPTLKGRLVTLRPLEEKDWTGLLKAASNPKTWAGHTATCQNRYQEDVFRGFSKRRFPAARPSPLLIITAGLLLAQAVTMVMIPSRAKLKLAGHLLTAPFGAAHIIKRLKA